MIRIPLAMIAAGALAAAAVPAFAQTDPHQPANDGSAAASTTVAPGQIAPGVDPGTSSANAGVNGVIQQNQASNAANQAQYQSDLSAYNAAMHAHGHQVASQDVHYAHQQRAYADAMEAWRIQTAACKRGHDRACNAPTPDPAEFY